MLIDSHCSAPEAGSDEDKKNDMLPARVAKTDFEKIGLADET